MSWTDERVELLKKMWGEGQSASQIAKELGGVTRNAVIGKVHRLGPVQPLGRGWCQIRSQGQARGETRGQARSRGQARAQASRQTRACARTRTCRRRASGQRDPDP